MFSAVTISPVSDVKLPRVFARPRCFRLYATSEWTPSTAQVPVT
jgi:hypothetical protein